MVKVYFIIVVSWVPGVCADCCVIVAEHCIGGSSGLEAARFLHELTLEVKVEARQVIQVTAC